MVFSILSHEGRDTLPKAFKAETPIVTRVIKIFVFKTEIFKFHVKIKLKVIGSHSVAPYDRMD